MHGSSLGKESQNVRGSGDADPPPLFLSKLPQDRSVETCSISCCGGRVLGGDSLGLIPDVGNRWGATARLQNVHSNAPAQG